MDDFEAIVHELATYTNDILGNVEYTENYLDKLNAILENIIDTKHRVANVIDQATSGELVSQVASDLAEEARENYNTILINKARNALLVSEEFDNAVYRLPLMEVLRDPDAFVIEPSINGWASRLKIENNLDELAGTLEEWAKAVEYVRETHDWNKAEPNKASEAWAKWYRGRGASYWQVAIAERLQASSEGGAIAPFWELLDKGSVPLASDKGGFPTPRGTATHFIDDTITEIRRQFNNKLSLAHRDFEMFMSKAKNSHEMLVRLSKDIDNMIAIIVDILYGGIVEVPAKDPVEAALEKVSARYGDIMEFADINKVKRILQDLLLVGEVYSFPVTVEGRVEVTRSGSGRRARFSVSTLYQILGEE